MSGFSRVVHVQVPQPGGEVVTLACRLVFSADGAVLRIHPPPPAPRDDARRGAARAAVRQVDAWLSRPGGPGLAQLQREVEALGGLVEHLVDVEDDLAPGMAAPRVGA